MGGHFCGLLQVGGSMESVPVTVTYCMLIAMWILEVAPSTSRMGGRWLQGAHTRESPRSKG
eukprot:4637510-Amphidinium_carterae.2